MKIWAALGNKLTNAHVKWEKQKMVRLAVQALSASVADALEFCETELNLPEIKDPNGTARLTRIFDQLFDMLNSRNRLASCSLFALLLRRSYDDGKLNAQI